MSGIVAVVFDLDGTLFDHDGSVLDALSAWWPELDDSTRRDATDAWFAAENRYLALWRSRELSWAEQRRQRLRAVLPLFGCTVRSDRELDAVFGHYLSHYEAAWRGFNDLDSLERLSAQGLRLAVLTNGMEEQQRAKLAALGILDRFEFVLTAEALGAAKPSASVFRTTCERLGLPPGEVLHVGDSIELDVRAPAAAGLEAVLVDRLRRSHDVPAIGSLLDLPAHVVSLGYEWGLGPTEQPTRSIE